MEDYRYRLIEIEEEFADEELEEDEFEEEDEEEEDYEDDREHEQNLIPEAVAMPVHLGIFQTGELEDGDDEEYEEDEEDYEEEEEEEELFPVVRLLDRDLNNNNNNNININLIEDDDYEDEDYEDEDEEDYEDEEEEEEEEDYEEEEVLEELFPAEMTSPRVSRSVVHGGIVLGGMVVNDDDNGVVEDSSGGLELCEGKFGNGEKCGGECSFCPICFEAWTSGGEHQICCLPCGHIYGLSCIKKWLQQSPNSGKCPQCNNICTLKDVRVLYASRLCVADEELQKRVRSLEAQCAYLEQKAGQLTPDELVDQICSNPAAVQRLATVLAGLTQQPVSP